VLSVWESDRTLKGIRNQALISLSLATGGRVSEVCKVRWQDINFDEGILDIVAGKGNNSRQVAIVDGTGAINDLILWSSYMPDTRVYVFCPVRRGDKLGEDKAMTPSAAQKMIKATSTVCGISFTHHTFRRTHVTEHLRNGAALGDIQAQTGHKRAHTLLEHYFIFADASKRRKTLKNRWKK
jgi:integrase/recombinase XerD